MADDNRHVIEIRGVRCCRHCEEPLGAEDSCPDPVCQLAIECEEADGELDDPPDALPLRPAGLPSGPYHHSGNGDILSPAGTVIACTDPAWAAYLARALTVGDRTTGRD